MRYDFFVHRRVSRWRLVLTHDTEFPSHTSPAQWQRTRTRIADDTNADIRDEVTRRGYCLFKIGASFEDLEAELRTVDLGADQG